MRTFLTTVIGAVAIWGAAASAETEIRMKIDQTAFFKRTPIPQGRGRGQLFYRFDPVMTAITPTGISVSPDGSIWILESELNRVQRFAANGTFLFGIDAAQLRPRANAIVAVKALSPTVVAIVTADVPGSATPGGPALRTFDVATGHQRSHHVLDSEPFATASLERATFDTSGSLWVFTDRWLCFQADGRLGATLDERDGFVDLTGRLYIPDKTLQVMDRDGRLLASLAFPDSKDVMIAGGSLETILFAWGDEPEDKQPENTVSLSNTLHLFRADLERRVLVEIDRLELPKSRYHYPNPQLDFLVPDQVYIRDLTVFRDGVFWFLAYSDTQYWIDRFDWASWHSSSTK
jgi:hypothetical protein